MFTIHNSAKENFDSKVLALLKSIKPAQKFNASPCYPEDIHINIKFKECNFQNSHLYLKDINGNIIDRFFIFNDIKYSFGCIEYSNLKKIAEAISNIKNFKNKVSTLFIENLMFEWLVETFSNRIIEKSFIEHLINAAQNSVKEMSVYIPISHTIVETPFKFCGATVKTFSKKMFDEIENDFSANTDNKKDIGNLFNRLRSNFQGYTIIKLNIIGEKNFIKEYSLNTANKITDLLGIYSPAIYSPTLKCYSRPSGHDTPPSFTYFIYDGYRRQINESILESSPNRVITKSKLEEYAQCGLFKLSKIEIKINKTDFENSILNMAYIYCKAAFTKDPLEKLVYMLSALESILLKNENESIQQNLAERIAFFISNNIDERKSIIKNIKFVYSIRSRYLHHGHSISDLEQLTIFFVKTWVFFVKLLLNAEKFSNKSNFINYIDDIKLS